jgi:hypothetical protein
MMSNTRAYSGLKRRHSDQAQSDDTAGNSESAQVDAGCAHREHAAALPICDEIIDIALL